MSLRRPLWLLFVTCALGLAVPLVLGIGYADRLVAPGGFYTVHVDDAVVTDAPVRRPRTTTLVVFDGLGHEEARTMPSLKRLRARGQCRTTDVGSLPLSRPVYAALSSGLEVDRGGVRFNDDTSALPARSIWALGRAAGLRVAAISEVNWWQELFPHDFDTYVVAPIKDDYFTLAPAADLRLIHPLYVDAAGHEFGAGSPQYHEAVARADRELDRHLDTLDLERDLLVVTADHGHSLLGGHGGRQDRVARVLTCFAGPGVRPLERPGPLLSTSIAPALAVLLGLPFPAEMRASDDELDVLWDIADPAAFSADYLADRQRSLARFRAANAAQLRAWWPASAGSWDAFYAHHRAIQRRRALPALAAVIALWTLQARAHRRRRPALFGLGFVITFYLTLFLAQVGIRGSFDLSAVAGREQFLGFTMTLALLSTLAAISLHASLRRDLAALLRDLAALSLTGTLLSLAHPLAFGWYPGFPAPSPSLFFFPYFAALALPITNSVIVLFGLACVVTAQRARTAPI